MRTLAARIASVSDKMGEALPAEFQSFAKVMKAHGPRWLELGWTDPCPLLNASKSAREALVPFLKLGDGGVLAFWDDGGEQRVVLCDSEGGQFVIASSFDDFLVRLGNSKTPWLERLDLEGPLDAAGWGDGKAPRRIGASLDRKLRKWVESHSLSAKPVATADGAALRKKLHAIAKQMLRDGRSKVYKLRDFHWDIDLRLTKNQDGWSATYLDYGKWHALPVSYGVVELVPELLRFVKSPRKKMFELAIHKDGHVFADKGNEFNLPPEG